MSGEVMYPLYDKLMMGPFLNVLQCLSKVKSINHSFLILEAIRPLSQLLEASRTKLINGPDRRRCWDSDHPLANASNKTSLMRRSRILIITKVCCLRKIGPMRWFDQHFWKKATDYRGFWQGPPLNQQGEAEDRNHGGHHHTIYSCPANQKKPCLSRRRAPQRNEPITHISLILPVGQSKEYGATLGRDVLESGRQTVPLHQLLKCVSKGHLSMTGCPKSFKFPLWRSLHRRGSQVSNRETNSNTGESLLTVRKGVITWTAPHFR